MTEPADSDSTTTPAEAPPPDPAAIRLQMSGTRRLRALPALALASMLVAGGLLMTVGGMVRLVGPAPATPTPAVGASPSPVVTPVPTLQPVQPTLGPSPSPFGDLERGPATGSLTGGATKA